MNLRNIIASYYDNPVMTKVNSVENHSIYKVRINSLLLNQHRFLVAMVDRDAFAFGHEVELKQLKWHVFQAITQSVTENCRNHSYRPKIEMPYITPLFVVKHESDHSCYRTPRIKATFTLIKCGIDYPDQGAISSALETYNTVVVLDEYENR
jgi:hypothetical protein